ncbi:MAG: hypothetical protein HYY76_20810 [Acidobacteria bacterium]|nr:hypothetical protein [Acidobacteriota bacterium]
MRIGRTRSWFGTAALAFFLLMQCLDGILTYLGVTAFGVGVEGNPIVAALTTHLGHGLGLLSAKIAAAALGVCLHLHEIHAAVALLAGFYLTAAVAPWTVILFF